MCKHSDGFIDLTHRQVRLASKQPDRPDLYTIEGSPFIVKRCGCPDAPPIEEGGIYVRLLWPTALAMVGAKEDG